MAKINFPSNPSLNDIVERGGKQWKWDGVKWRKLIQSGEVVSAINGQTGEVTLHKSDIGLGDVENYPVATTAEAEAGTHNGRYMTPLRTKEAILELSPPTDIDAHLNTSTASAGEVLQWDGSDYIWQTGGGTVIAPFAFGFVASTSNGSGTGISWSNWNSSNHTLDFTFTNAQQNTNYTVITDSETFDDFFVGITNKTTTGFRAEFYDNSQSRTPSSFSPFTFLVYGSTPVVTVLGNTQDYAFSSLTGLPTTISGYGITDAYTKTEIDTHINSTSNPHSVTKAQVGLGNVTNDAQIPLTQKGAALGVAELDANGKVLSSQLPSFVDDVLEYANLAGFPTTGETGKIYIAQDTNLTYRWSGSAYAEISSSLALGETSSTAYRGDRGKIAYDHSQITSGNPHNVTLAELGYVAPTIGNGGFTVTAGSGLTGGGPLGTANQTGNSAVTLSHADTSSQASTNNSGRTYIQNITLDTYGHITGVTTATETVVNTDTDTITRLRGTTSGTFVSGDITLAASGATSISQSGNTITISSTDTNTDTNNYLTGVSGSGNGTVTFTRQGLSNLTWDASHNHDDRYYTETESNANFIKRTSTTSALDVNAANGTQLFTGSTGAWTNRGPSGNNAGALLSLNTHSGNYYSQLWFDTANRGLYHRRANGGTGVTESWQRIFADDYHPNADKWTTARTLSLTGDVTGSVSWDGSGNASMTTTVVDDSHNHIIANVDGLQAALDGKAPSSHTHSYLPLSGGTMSGAINLNRIGSLGTEIRIGAGESLNSMTGTAEAVYIAGESGVYVYASSDNLASGLNRSATVIDSSGNASWGSGTITAGTFSGNLSGNATTATTATNADKLDGYDWMQSGKSVRGTEFYADNWFRNYNSGEGLYNEATGMHWYSTANNQFSIYSGQTSTNIRFMTSGGNVRGYVHADNGNNIGFLDEAGNWSLRMDDGNTANFTGSTVTSGDAYGRSVNGSWSSLYRWGGLYFTWDSDSYGTNTNHSIRSTYGDSWGDHITLNSFGHIRMNIDSNNNGSNNFEVGRHTTGTDNTLFQITDSGQTNVYTPLNVHGNILLTGGATTTNQDRLIDFTGFDKEGTTDFSDRAYIQHTTNTGGHSGSVLVISSQNDSNDGIAFQTNASSLLKHNSNNIFTDGYHPNADKLTTARNIALTGAVTGNANFDGSGNISIATTATSDPTLTINGDASGSATFTNLGNATLTLTVNNDSHDHTRLTERATISYGAGWLQWTDVSGTGGAGTNGAAPANPTNEWWHHLIMNHANSAGYYVDIAAAFHSDDIYFRRNVAGNLQSWREIIHSGNIASQSVAYADNADRALDADYAGSVPWSGVTGAPAFVTSSGVTSIAISNGGGLSVSGSPITSSGTITISHSDTSGQASVNNSGRTVIQDVFLDTYGHVTSLTSYSITPEDVFGSQSSFRLGSSTSLAGTSSIAFGGGADARASYSTAVGGEAEAGVDSSHLYSSAFGYDATALGYYDTALGEDASIGSTYDSSTAVGSNASVTASNMFRLGGTNITNLACSDTTISTTSDVRDKADFGEVDKALELILNLEPVTYVRNPRGRYEKRRDEMDEHETMLWKEYGFRVYDKEEHAKQTKKGTRRQIGFKAQDVAELMQQLYGSDNYAGIVNIDYYDQEVPEGIENRYSVEYARLVPFLVKAIQEQQKQIDELKSLLSE